MHSNMHLSRHQRKEKQTSKKRKHKQAGNAYAVFMQAAVIHNISPSDYANHGGLPSCCTGANCFSCQSPQFHRSCPSLVLACMETGMVPRYLAASTVVKGSLTVQFATSRKCCQKWNVQMWLQSKLNCVQVLLLAMRCFRSAAGRASPAFSNTCVADVLTLQHGSSNAHTCCICCSRR